jgi:hypothetical protein
VAQGVGPEFKRQYHKKQTTTTIKKKTCFYTLPVESLLRVAAFSIIVAGRDLDYFSFII